MLLSVQSFDIEAIGIRRRSWSIDAPGLWIRLVRQVGMGAEEALIRLLGFGRPAASRQLIGVGLRGHTLMRVAGTTFETQPGHVVVLPGRASYSTRLEADGGESFSMTIELDANAWRLADATPTWGHACDPAQVRAHAEALCIAIERAWADPAARPLVDQSLLALFALLRTAGLPVPAIDVRAFTPIADPLARLARAVDRALSQTHSRAMLVDVESDGGVCARTFQRSLPALCALWGQSLESFRDHTRRSLLARACWAMTNSRATTELVARAVGFSTPNAFCRAMAHYGLPSPGRVRQRFAELA